MVTISLIAYFINIPLGYWRAFQRRFSVKWFIAIHASVPFIIALRYILDVPSLYALLFITLAVSGQITGARLIPKLLKKAADREKAYGCL